MTLIEEFAYAISVLAILPIVVEALCRRVAAGRPFRVYLPSERWQISPLPELSSRIPRQSTLICNSGGERGPERKPESAFQILLCGGSAGECLMLSNEQSLGGQTEHKLNSAGFPTQVGSICRSGLNTMGVARALECIRPVPGKLDMVVALIGASDVLNWVHLDGDPEAVAQPDDSKIFRCRPRSDYAWKWARSASKDTLWHLRYSYFRHWTKLLRAGRRQVASRQKLRELPALSLSEVRDIEALLESIRDSTKRLVTVAGDSARRVVIVPQIYISHHDFPEVEGTFWQGTIERGPRLGARFSTDVIFRLMDMATEAILDTARTSGAGTIDLRVHFKASPQFFYDEFHLTELGSEKLGECLAAQLHQYLKKDSANQ